MEAAATEFEEKVAAPPPGAATKIEEKAAALAPPIGATRKIEEKAAAPPAGEQMNKV